MKYTTMWMLEMENMLNHRILRLIKLGLKVAIRRKLLILNDLIGAFDIRTQMQNNMTLGKIESIRFCWM
jgi:hypothetical protein